MGFSWQLARHRPEVVPYSKKAQRNETAEWEAARSATRLVARARDGPTTRKAKEIGQRI
jgi:hypothetical protein